MMASLEAKIKELLAQNGSVVVAIDGKCGAGKSTFARSLIEKYGGRLYHADDYFLRPEQRTPERLAEIGGNFDRERFYSEVVIPVTQGEETVCKRFSCATMTLEGEVRTAFAPLTVIEGCYCLHPELGRYYDISVFMNVDAEEQSRRILERSGKEKHKRFVSEWIPMENAYFYSMKIPEKCNFILEL